MRHGNGQIYRTCQSTTVSKVTLGIYLALCITVSYIIPITGIAWGIRGGNQKENWEVQGGMLEGAGVEGAVTLMHP